MAAKYPRISRLFKQRGESEAVLSPPGAAQSTAAVPSAGDRSSGTGHPDAPFGCVSSEDLPAWRQDEKRACGGVDLELRQGGWGPSFQEHHEGETTGIPLPPARVQQRHSQAVIRREPACLRVSHLFKDVPIGQEVKELTSPCRHHGTCKFCDSQHPPEEVLPFPFYCLKEHYYYFFLLWKERCLLQKTQNLLKPSCS